jgi:hypothetical protein
MQIAAHRVRAVVRFAARTVAASRVLHVVLKEPNAANDRIELTHSMLDHTRRSLKKPAGVFYGMNGDLGFSVPLAITGNSGSANLGLSARKLMASSYILTICGIVTSME